MDKLHRYLKEQIKEKKINNIKKCNFSLLSQLFTVRIKENIIITMTSWKKRIENVPIVLSTILNQSKKPDKIVLNLSSDEFRNKERDIPKSVIDFFEEHKNVSKFIW